MSEQEPQDHSTPDSLEKPGATYPNRRNSWDSSIDALAYIYGLLRKPELQIRQSDRITGFALLLATTGTILCLLLRNMTGLNLKIMMLCDFFLGVSLIIYVFNRLGILTALPPRQALLTWQLIQAFTYVGVFIAINAALILSAFLSAVPLGHLRLP